MKVFQYKLHVHLIKSLCVMIHYRYHILLNDRSKYPGLFNISNRVNQRYFCLAKRINPADQNKCLIKYRPNR